MKKKLLLAALTLAALGVGAPTAGADDSAPHRYRGGCSYAVVDDPADAFGGTQNGVVSLLLRSTDEAGTPTADSLSASCELFVDGVSQGIIASGGNSLLPTVAKFQFVADQDAVVSVCVHVHGGWWSHTHCDDGSLIPDVGETLSESTRWLDRTLCDYVLSPRAGTYGPVYIDDTGDVYLFGYTDDDLWWDCPPYYVPPND